MEVLKCLILAFIVFSSTTHYARGQTWKYVSVLLKEQGEMLYIEEEFLANAVAWAKFSNKVNETGWSFLEVHTNKAYTDELQSRAAGIAEGFLTADLIAKHWSNTLSTYCANDKEMCRKLRSFLERNEIFVANSIESNLEDTYWYQVKLLYDQLAGLYSGYKMSEVSETVPLSAFDFTLMQLGGLSDLEQALMNRTTKHRVVGQGSCSALIKLLPNNTDLLISHVTWTNYATMLRIYKLYELQLVNNANPEFHIVAQNHSFSSYPGLLYSGDDFYMLSSGLVTQETTIENYNNALWKYVTTETVMEWARTVVANRISKDGRDWVITFSKYNSGTYNNQWMVLDYNKFTPGKPVTPNTLWVLEQLPGTTEMTDVSIHLHDKQYWASYNIPYFPYIFNLSGSQKKVDKYGSWFSYDLAPRAQMFKRDQGNVTDLASMLKLMRYNDYKNDPLAKCACSPPYSAENAISARCDLNPANGTYPFEALGHREHGSTDAKVTTSKMFKDFTVLAVSGPTFDQQPVFQWSKSGWSKPAGHPDKFDFKPLLVTWSKEAPHKTPKNAADADKPVTVRKRPLHLVPFRV